jgi:hypothetical protein
LIDELLSQAQEEVELTEKRASEGLNVFNGPDERAPEELWESVGELRTERDQLFLEILKALCGFLGAHLEAEQKQNEKRIPPYLFKITLERFKALLRSYPAIIIPLIPPLEDSDVFIHHSLSDLLNTLIQSSQEF